MVSNAKVSALYMAQLLVALRPHFVNITSVELPDGEVFKDWSTLNLIFDHLLGSGADRRTILFALGGGVIGS